MRVSTPLSSLLLVCAAGAALAQAPAPPPTLPPPAFVQGYIVTLQIDALAPEAKTPPKASGEAEALLGKVRQSSSLKAKIWMSQDLSRMEILSPDFIFPQGSLLLHKSGDKFYAIADPKAQSYVVMEAGTLLNALEGSAGIVNSSYEARVRHTPEKKEIAGHVCRHSVVTVTYVSSVPFENDRVLVQQQNDVDVWHTADLVESTALDHLFFRFQRDRTGTVQKVLSQEIGFPLEISFVVSSGPTSGPAKKGAQAPQPGSFHMLVSEVKIEGKLESELFRIPPTGYKRVEKNPYFATTTSSGGN
jgi:hypothetical protein